LSRLLLLSNYSSGLSQEYGEGEVIRGTVVARADVSGVDIVETKKGATRRGRRLGQSSTSIPLVREFGA